MAARWCHLASVLGDYGRYIPARPSRTDRTASSLVEMGDEAAERTGLAEVPL